MGNELTKKVRAARKKAGGSNVGKYKRVKTKDFAGPAGGAPAGSFPINTIDRARSAIKLSGNAPRPAALREKVYKKYPSLRPKKKS